MSSVGTGDGGVVNVMVGGVGGSLDVHADLGDVMNLLVDLVYGNLKNTSFRKVEKEESGL